MILDSAAFKPVLTPEAALGIVQKSVAGKGWKHYDVTDIRLIYTPYWIFSFDVIGGAEGMHSGKTSLNAYTGEISDFIPFLVERPLKKTKNTEEGTECEVEETTVDGKEVKEIAQTKVAVQLGLKKEDVTASAFSKCYAPYYRIWVDVHGDTHKIDVDACLGMPLGIDGIPERPKTFGEKAGESFKKLGSLKGASEVASEASSALIKPENKMLRYAVIGLAIAVLMFLVFSKTSGGSVSCELYEKYYGKPAFLGLIGQKAVKPASYGSVKYVKGECDFLASKNADEANGAEVVMVQVKVKEKSSDRILNALSIIAQPPSTTSATTKQFELNWTAGSVKEVVFEFEKIG